MLTPWWIQESAFHDPGTGSNFNYSTYLGGAGFDSAAGVAADPDGNAYVTGETDGAGFPVTPGALQGAIAAGRDAFVLKMHPSGSSLIFSTFLGGDGFQYFLYRTNGTPAGTSKVWDLPASTSPHGAPDPSGAGRPSRQEPA